MPYQGRLPYTYKSPFNTTLDQGTQTVPSLAFLGDTNNGLFSPATDNVAITTNGSEKLRVTSGGNVGIGTTNPSSKLHVYNGDLELTGGYNLSWGGTFSGGNPTIWGNASNKTIRFAPDGNTTGLVALLGASSSYILGNVGIGTTNPGYTLDVQGSQNVTTQISLWGRTIGQPQTLIEPGRIYATSAGLGPGNLLLQPTGGNLGIGTESPSENLHIHAPGNDLAAIILSGTAVGQVPYQVRQGINGVSNSGFSIYDITAAATRFAIDSAGNIGIGTGTPTSGLQVTKSGTLFFPDNVWMQPSGNTLITARGSSGQDNWMGISGHYYATTGSSNILLQANFGDLGSHAGHYISSTATAIGSSYFTIGRILASGGVGTPAIKEPQLNISSAGNVGIGTANPITKLDTRGTLHVGGGSEGIWLGNAGDNAAYDNVKLYYTGYNSGSPRVYLTPRTQPGSGTVNTYLHLLSNNVPGPGSNTMGLLVDGSVGIGTTNFTAKLSVNGETSVGQGKKLSFIGLDINSGGIPSYIKIKTTIPFASGGADFTINIKGFRYGGSQVANLSICWHFYNNNFYNPVIISSGSWAPTVVLSNESGLVCITLYSPGYWPKLYVESMYSSTYSDLYCTGWSWVDEAPGGTNNVTVSYKSDFGNSFVMASDGNVGIGTASPTQKLSVYGSVQINQTGKALYLNAYPGTQDNTVSFESIRADYSTGASVLEIQTKNTSNDLQRRMRILHNGVILMGSLTSDAVYTTGANLPLQVEGGYNAKYTNAFAGQSEILIASNFSGAVGTAIKSYVYSTGSNGYGLTLHTSPNYITPDIERLRITHDGNVGIGTTNPIAKLDVRGDIFTSGVINQSNGEQQTSMRSGSVAFVENNTWYDTGFTFAFQYNLIAFMLFLSFENNAGDGNNTTALFMSPGTNAYTGGGGSPFKIAGASTLEAQIVNSSPYALQVKTTSVGGGAGESGSKLRWWILNIPGN